MSQNQTTRPPFVSPGMPPLKLGKTRSFFEFWPSWLMYLPVALQWLLLSIRYRSLTLPLIANPELPLSGMVGVPKSLLLDQASGEVKEAILDWFIVTKSEQPLNLQATETLEKCAERNITFPFVCKPDIGCRGNGVRLVENRDQLLKALAYYPVGAGMMIQRLADFEAEAGVFYVREPGERKGKIISLALKYTPYVVGDGNSTLEQLIENDVRASELVHLYQKRHKQNWDQVIPSGQPYRLVFSASHSKGAIFKDASHLITTELSQKISKLMEELPEFYYGRLDIKFNSVEQLKAGESMQIVEINTASSEPLHIWDSNTAFLPAVRSLLFQYRKLFEIGHANRAKGYKPPPVGDLYRHWRLEQKLSRQYPETD